MKRVTLTALVLSVGGLCSVANAGVSDNWDIFIQMGDGNAWSVRANPQSYTFSEYTNAEGKTLYRIIGGWSNANWTCSWNVEFDPDPFVSSSFTITNNSGVLAPFTVTVNTPAMALTAPTTMTGSISGTVGDGDGVVDQFGNGASVMTQANGRPYYDALTDGLSARELYSAPQFHSAPVGLTASIPTANFINEIGPAVAGSIGIRNAFMLTPGDNASFTSTFFIIPAPAGVAAFALAGLVGLRRRR
jgi:hypothetical protein